MKLIWSFKCLSQLGNKLGFVWLSDSEAATLIASGDVQFPGIGGRRLHYLQRCTGTTPPIPTVPKVLSSIIPANGDGIMVTFDRPMTMTASLQDAMSVIIGSGSPVHPDHISISSDKKQIGLMFPSGHFKSGDVVTWAYNDQHPTEELKGSEAGGMEIDNQTYGIVNNSNVVITLVAPHYDMDTPLKNTNFIDDSVNIATNYDGELSFTPTALEYPENGTLDIKTNSMNTHYQITDGDGEYGIYDVVKDTSYKIYAAKYRSDGKVDVYLGGNIGETYTPVAFSHTTDYPIPVGNRIIDDTPPTYVIRDTIRVPVYVSLGKYTSDIMPPQGVTINEFIDSTDITTNNQLSDIDGNISDITFRFDTVWATQDGVWIPETGNTECMSDMQLQRALVNIGEGRLSIYLPKGTFDVTVGIKTTYTSDNYDTIYVLDGVTKTLEAITSSTKKCGTWRITSTGADYMLVGNKVPTGINTTLNGFNITEVTP